MNFVLGTKINLTVCYSVFANTTTEVGTVEWFSQLPQVPHSAAISVILRLQQQLLFGSSDFFHTSAVC
jgi:hypothetical protein